MVLGDEESNSMQGIVDTKFMIIDNLIKIKISFNIFANLLFQLISFTNNNVCI